MRELVERLVGEGNESVGIVYLIDVQGQTAEEVAEALGIPKARVTNRLWRGRRKVRAALGAEVP